VEGGGVVEKESKGAGRSSRGREKEKGREGEREIRPRILNAP
jgi:hypothetical protein